MKLPIFQVDAFADRTFSGNPAAVCPLEAWLEKETMQQIAEENNLSETAFFVSNGDDFDIRWFSPKAEIDLAGHPTMATAYIIFTELEPTRTVVRFNTQSGENLTVIKKNDVLIMDFPSWPPAPTKGIDIIAEALGARPSKFLAARDAFAVFDNEADIRAIEPDFMKLLTFDNLGVIVTAPGNEVDFVSRFFAPKHGIFEDPVTGSAHCELIPYWADRLGKTKLVARQLSSRGGEIYCTYLDGRVEIGGKAVTFMRGEIEF